MDCFGAPDGVLMHCRVINEPRHLLAMGLIDLRMAFVSWHRRLLELCRRTTRDYKRRSYLSQGWSVCFLTAFVRWSQAGFALAGLLIVGSVAGLPVSTAQSGWIFFF